MLVADIAPFVGVTWLLFVKTYVPNGVCSRSSHVTQMRSRRGTGPEYGWGFKEAPVLFVKSHT